MTTAPRLVAGSLVLLVAACTSASVEPQPTTTARQTPRAEASHTPEASHAPRPSPTLRPTPTPGPPISAACQGAFAAAAAIPPFEDSVEDLDPAVRDCVTLEEWGAGADANPGAIERGVDPYEYLGNRCDDSGAGLLSTVLCQELVAACDTPPYSEITFCYFH